MSANHRADEEEHALEHLRSIGAERAQALLQRLEQENCLPQHEALVLLAKTLAWTDDGEWERIQGDLWEARGHLRNGRALDDEDFRGGHVAG
jgi:hypothetical protein